MASEPFALLLHYLRTRLGPADVAAATDGHLLGRFAGCGDEAAFEVLVRRHGPLVWRVCRRVLASEHDAEDAFQATFLVLVRKAWSIRKQASVASWLYGVAHRIALRARAKAQRQRASELPNTAATADVVSEASGQEVQAILDEELAQLPERLRAPLLLCCLEGRSRTEAAHQLGWREGTVASRLARARQCLCGRLARRGVQLSVVAFTALLARETMAAVPSRAVRAAVRAAGLYALGDAVATPAVSTPVAALAKGALQAMFMAKLKLGTVLALVCGILAAGAGLAVPRVLEGNGPVAVQGDAPRAVAKPADTPSADAPKQTRTDYYGDPLPNGALARMGTIRFRHPSGHLGFAHVTFSADGQTVISAGPDWAVRSWDKASGQQVQQRELRPSQPPGDHMREAVLSPGGKLVAVFEKETVALYETATGRELRRLAVGPASRERLRFSPDGQVLAAMISLGLRYTIRLWDVSTGTERFVLRHKRLIEDFAFSPNGKLLASSCQDNVLYLWDATTGTELRNAGVEYGCVAFSPDGKTVAVSNRHGAVTLREVATLNEQESFRPAADVTTASCSAYSPDGVFLAVGGDKDLVLWDVAGPKEPRRFAERTTRNLAFAPDSKTLACMGEREIHLWDVTTGLQIHPRPGHDGNVIALAISPDGKIVASTAWDNTLVRLWDAATGKPLPAYLRHEDVVRSCDFSMDGKLLVTSTGSRDGTVRLWETATGKEVRRFVMEDLKGGLRRHEALVCQLSPDGKRVAAVSCTWDRTQQSERCQMNVWEAQTGKLLVRRPFRGFLSSRFTPDGLGVTVDSEECLTIEETTTGRELLRVPGNQGQPVAFSPDGRLVAVGLHGSVEQPMPREGLGRAWQRKGVRVVEVATGQEIFHLEGSIDCVAFSPDSRVLATTDPEAFRLWDAVTGAPLFQRAWPENLKGRRGLTPIGSLAFLPGGRALATGMTDGTILVWDLTPESWRADGIAKDLDRKELDGLWTDLADPDARKAYRAIRLLAAAPSQSVPFLANHLQPVSEPDWKRVQQRVADLDSEKFTVRAAAADELAKFGERIEPALRQVLAGKPSAEVRQRVEALLADLPTTPGRETLRTLRAVQVLERIGTAEAKQVLWKLASGAAAARETREAKDALERSAGPVGPQR